MEQLFCPIDPSFYIRAISCIKRFLTWNSELLRIRELEILIGATYCRILKILVFDVLDGVEILSHCRPMNQVCVHIGCI